MYWYEFGKIDTVIQIYHCLRVLILRFGLEAPTTLAPFLPPYMGTSPTCPGLRDLFELF